MKGLNTPDDSTEEANGDDIYRDFIFHPNFQLADKGSRIKLTGNSLQNVEYGLIQHIKNPLTVSRCSWFKMKVEEFPKDESFIMFGLNECCKEFGGPMWDRLSSLRYCSDTGGIFTKGVGVRSDYPYGKGDEIICLLEKSFPDRSLINFLKNGKFVGREWAYLESDNLYATIGINKGPASLIVEWPRLGSLEPIMRQDLISNWVGCRHIELKEEDSTATMAKDDVDGREAFAIQSPRPFNKDHTYFEVTLLNRVNGEYGPCIGVTAPVFNKYRAPGWDCFTFGYHGDDGAIFHETPESYVEVNDEWKCNLGDRIGIGIIFPKGVSTNNIHDIQPVMIYITKNGQYLRHKCILQPRGGFYPTLSLFRKGDKVKVCYPCTPPKLPTNVEHDLVTQGAMVKEFRFLPSVNVSNSDKHKGKTIQVSEDDKCPYRMVQYIKEAMEPNTYFEVTLGEIDTSTDFRIGIATRSDPVDSTSLEEGVCKCCFSLQHRAVVYNQKIGPKIDACKSGDTIGCYMVSRSANGQEFTMCFLINDINIGIQTIENKAGLKVYPTIVFGQLKLNVGMKWLQKKRLLLTTKNLKSWVRPSKNVLINKNTLKMIKPQTDSDSIICHSPIPVIKNDISYLEFKLTEKNLKGNFPRVGVRTLSSVYDDKTVKVLFKPEECVIGDIIGCNVTLSEDGSHPLTALIQFYKNSVVQYKKLIDLTSDGLCFAVEFTTAGDSVSIKFDAKVPISLPSLEFKDHQDTECSSKKQNTHKNKNDELADGTGLQSNLDNFNYLGTAVFISHTNSDIQKVNCIFHKLKMDNCFVDMSLWHPEEDNKKEIISSSEIIIFCLSNASLKDSHQQTELKWISKAGIPIIPLLLEDMPWPPGGSNTDQKKYFNKYDHVKLKFSDIIIDSCMLIKYIDDTKLNKPRTDPTYADFTDVPPPAQYSSHNTSSKACEIL